LDCELERRESIRTRVTTTSTLFPLHRPRN